MLGCWDDDRMPASQHQKGEIVLNYPSFTHKIALITGAGSGIGRAM
jgi:hypothetical protein